MTVTNATISVPNPEYQPGNPGTIARITVRRALRDDPLGRLHARRQIGDAQYRAGRVWQATYEAAMIGHVGAIDPSNEPVDGSKRFASPDLDRITRATRSLAAWDRVLGADGSAIVRNVLAEHQDMEEIAKKRGQHSRSARDYYGKRFRECLSSLVKAMNLA